MKAINSLVVWCREKKKTEDGENVFFKALAKNLLLTSKTRFPAGMWLPSDVSVKSHIGQDVKDHAEMSSRRRNRYVNETDLFETSLRRLIGTWKKLTYLRRHNDLPIDT